MLVMFDVTNPVERAHTMTKREGKKSSPDIKALISADEDFLRSAVRTAIQAALEAEMTEALAAERSERVARLSQRLVWPLADHPCRCHRVAGAARPRRAVFDRVV